MGPISNPRTISSQIDQINLVILASSPQNNSTQSHASSSSRPRAPNSSSLTAEFRTRLIIAIRITPSGNGIVPSNIQSTLRGNATKSIRCLRGKALVGAVGEVTVVDHAAADNRVEVTSAADECAIAALVLELSCRGSVVAVGEGVGQAGYAV